MGADKITICHWNEGGRWEAIDIDHSALQGHTRHEMDIWPPVPEITDGNNWPVGQQVYLNGCSIVAEALPSPTAAPTPSIPPTGAVDVIALILFALTFIAVGIYLFSKRD